MCRRQAFSKPVKAQAPIAATIKGLCQAACSDSILHTQKGKNTLPQRSGNLHEPSQTATGQSPPERQEKMGTRGSLDEKGTSPRVLHAREGSC